MSRRALLRPELDLVGLQHVEVGAQVRQDFEKPVGRFIRRCRARNHNPSERTAAAAAKEPERKRSG
jgi:hypothetical protein